MTEPSVARPSTQLLPGAPRRVLVVAVSARMTAGLAVADGFDVVSLDRFGDADLRALCPGRSIARDLGDRGGMADLVDLADRGNLDADAVVYGAGLENRPDLVARLAAGRTLLGTPPAALGVVRDPGRLAQALGDAGLAMPETWAPGAARPAPAGRSVPSAAAPVQGRGSSGRGHPAGSLRPLSPVGRDAPAVDDRWLRKPRRGGGGRGVRRWRGGVLDSNELLQREVRGLAVSVVAIAHGSVGGAGPRADILAVTEQLVGERRLGARGFAWCGNVSPPRLPGATHDALGTQMTAAANVAARLGVRGAFGVDAIWDGERAWILEVNPRPTAGLELAALLGEPSLFARHVAACLGADPAAIATSAGARDARAPAADAVPGRSTMRAGASSSAGAPRGSSAAKVVLYAREDVIAPQQQEWPAGVADLPHPGDVVPRGAPVCTLLGTGERADALVDALVARSARLPLRAAEGAARA